WGLDIITELVGGGDDTISFDLATTDVTFTRGIPAACPSGTCVTDGTNLVTHLGDAIENCTGGAGDDRLVLADAAALSGRFDGGLGTDTLDYSLYTTARTVTLTGLGTQDGFAGTATGLGDFDNLNAVVGSTASDTLIGMNTDSDFHIDGAASYYQEIASGRIFDFDDFENLSGGSANDTFYFHGVATLNGQINGGAGSDTLDYSNYALAISANLGAGTADGTAGISSIENLIGSPFGSTIYGDNNDNILIGTAANDTIYGLGGNDILFGLGGNDRLDGGTGIDTIDYSGNTTAGINANLATGVVTSSDSGTDTLLSIENVIGSSFADTIIGSNGNNVIDGRGGDDTLNGSAGNDRYLFGDDWGNDTLTDTSGSDTLDFSTLTINAAFDFTTSGTSVTSGLNTLNVTGTVIENVTSGTGDDSFNFATGAVLSGTLDGGLGNNSLNLTDSATITLTGIGSKVGFKGTVAGMLPSGFENISTISGAGASDELVGLNQVSTWTISNSGNTYLSSGRTFGFIDIENLTGGSASDTFAFNGTANLLGDIDGGLGVNLFDFSGYGADVALDLGLATVTGLGGSFSNIHSLLGSANVDTLSGYDAPNTFNITSVDSGNVNSTFAFSAVENLTGGDNDDTFKFAENATISGTLNAGNGTDLLDYSTYTTSVIVDLAAGTATANGVTATVTNFENIIGGLGDDTLTGDAGNNIITDLGGKDALNGGDGDDTYIFESNWGVGDIVTDSSGNDTMTFASLTIPLTFNLNAGSLNVTDSTNSVSHSGYSIENLIGGTAADTFNINDAASANLSGREGNDTFAFNGTGVLTGDLDGGIGTNNFDYSNYGVAMILDLQNGTITGLLGNFSNIQSLKGSANSDALKGTNANDTFNITDTNSGNINSAFTFTDIENLDGLDGDDNFLFSGSALLTGSIAGILGSDMLSYASYGSAVTVNLETLSSSGLPAFSGIETLVGSIFSDILHGLNAGVTFNISGTDSGNASGYTFTSFENLSGGTGADTFAFADGTSLSGQADGGLGIDTLDFSAYLTPRSVTLIGLGSLDGYAGTTSTLNDGFDNINALLGSSAQDSFTGMNTASTFDLNTSTYTETNSGRILTYLGFDNLNGGSANDQFNIEGTPEFNLNGGAGNDIFSLIDNGTAPNLDGTISGNAGSGDTLDYSQFIGDVTFNYGTGAATGVSSGVDAMVSGIENFTGTPNGTNTVRGDDNDNTLVGGSSNDNLEGGKGNDTYVFYNNWGVDTVVELPGEGNDTIDFSNVNNAGLTLAFDGTSYTFTDGLGNEVTTDNNVENFIGSSLDDRFIISNNAVIAGTLNGSSGNDSLDYSTYNSARNFVLKALGSLNGFMGTEASILGGFDNINDLIGTTLYIDSLTGMNAPATWNFKTAGNSYTSTNALTHSAIEKLKGGTDADTFAFDDGQTFDGSLAGGAGIDTLDAQLYTSAINVDLVAGTALLNMVSIPLETLENVIGGSADDEILGNEQANRLEGSGGQDNICGGEGDDIIIGGAGDDELCGGLGNDTFVFENGWGSDNLYENADEGTDTLNFIAVTDDLTITLGSIHVTDSSNVAWHAENNIEIIRSGSGADTFYIPGSHTVALYGGAGDDSFVFADGALHSGIVDGESGFDTIDFNQWTTDLMPILSDLGSTDGFVGTTTGLDGVFTNIDNIIGGSGVDTLTGRNADATFSLDTVNQYISGNTLEFSAFENLVGGLANDLFDIHGSQTYHLAGGAGDDTFSFANNSELIGTIDGQTGMNTMEYSRYLSSRDVYFTGLGSLSGFSGSEASLIGKFDNIGELIGGAVTDSLSSINTESLWTITASGGSYIAGENSLSFRSVETFNGGAFDDTFAFQKGGSTSGNIDGRGGNDILDLSQFTDGIFAELFNGIISDWVTGVDSIGGGVTSIEIIIGGAGADSLIGDRKNNTLDGGAGDDYIDGRAGDDTLITGSGFNTLIGGDYMIWGYDTAIIAYGSTYIIPDNDIENILFLQPVVA
ncbi:MAG: hypothetical protein DRH04_03515, partial [Deltaproteobacteria bacterium]